MLNFIFKIIKMLASLKSTLLGLKANAQYSLENSIDSRESETSLAISSQLSNNSIDQNESNSSSIIYQNHVNNSYLKKLYPIFLFNRLSF